MSDTPDVGACAKYHSGGPALEPVGRSSSNAEGLGLTTFPTGCPTAIIRRWRAARAKPAARTPAATAWIETTPTASVPATATGTGMGRGNVTGVGAGRPGPKGGGGLGIVVTGLWLAGASTRTSARGNDVVITGGSGNASNAGW